MHQIQKHLIFYGFLFFLFILSLDFATIDNNKYLNPPTHIQIHTQTRCGTYLEFPSAYPADATNVKSTCIDSFKHYQCLTF